MRLKIKKFGLLAGKPVCIINENTIKDMGLHVGNRVLIKVGRKKKIISVIDSATKVVHPGEIAISEEIYDTLEMDKEKYVDISIIEQPHSI